MLSHVVLCTKVHTYLPDIIPSFCVPIGLPSSIELSSNLLESGTLLYLLHLIIYFVPPVMDEEDMSFKSKEAFNSGTKLLVLCSNLLRNIALVDSTQLTKRILIQLLTLGMYRVLLDSSEEFLQVVRPPAEVSGCIDTPAPPEK